MNGWTIFWDLALCTRTITSMTLIFTFLLSRKLCRNQLTGLIPSSIGGLIRLETLSVTRDQQRCDSWTSEPSSAILLFAWTRKRMTLTFMNRDLQNNQLSGPIPLKDLLQLPMVYDIPLFMICVHGFVHQAHARTEWWESTTTIFWKAKGFQRSGSMSCGLSVDFPFSLTIEGTEQKMHSRSCESQKWWAVINQQPTSSSDHHNKQGNHADQTEVLWTNYCTLTVGKD